jgi:hypothetical protein
MLAAGGHAGGTSYARAGAACGATCPWTSTCMAAGLRSKGAKRGPGRPKPGGRAGRIGMGKAGAVRGATQPHQRKEAQTLATT